MRGGPASFRHELETEMTVKVIAAIAVNFVPLVVS